MNHKNDFKAFSISDNANIVSQEKYEGNEGLLTGFPPNTISIDLLNKVLRQSSIISSVVADFIATQSNDNILDDGDIIKLTAQLNRALEQKITAEVPNASLTQKGIVQLADVVGNSDTLAVTQKLAQEIINSLRENINDRVPNSRRVNGKTLSTDINLEAGDIGVYTKEEINNLINAVNNIPVGIPVPWPTVIPPAGWLQCNGAEFDKTAYPQLALAYPTGKLPDLRGEFIRGWDDTRGIDSGRIILSAQTDNTKRIQLSQGNERRKYLSNYQGPLDGYQYPLGRDVIGGATVTSIANNTGGYETRPRNIAFNYIVRAA
ncbi:tail fiber protein [Photorhabdus luminescens]|uniref:Phage tail protein n=1 Tax=Photorhabdus luminescens subsp. mexicana TaxID=2100167 RepID=A0A4R4JI78_PHOLU|nr:tail fiber protein [Photorhabdus luminescens]TDB54010.1 phage tail protein [Photorhabdus luminescens subsp. mexicana]